MKKNEAPKVVHLDGYTTEYSKKIKEMRLLDLPSELIAQITGRLEYSDVRNLMKTNKRICAAIRKHKKDKMRPMYLRFSDYPSFSCFASGDAYDIATPQADWKKYSFDNQRLEGTNVRDNIAHIISECSYVNKINFCRMFHLNSDIIDMVNTSRARIRSVSVEASEFECSTDEFITFCQKFEICDIKYIRIPDNFWTDDVFKKIIPHIQFKAHANEFYLKDYMNLTDRTLMKVFECASDFDIPGFKTSFTVKGIVEGLQMPLNKDDKRRRLFFLLGYLDFDQLKAADYYFNKDHGELKDHYEIEVSESEELYNNIYKLYYRRQKYTIKCEEPQKKDITFSVYIPVEDKCNFI